MTIEKLNELENARNGIKRLDSILRGMQTWGRGYIRWMFIATYGAIDRQIKLEHDEFDCLKQYFESKRALLQETIEKA